MIRKAERKDLPDILNIYNDAILNTTAVYAYNPQSLAERSMVRNKSACKRTYIYI